MPARSSRKGKKQKEGAWPTSNPVETSGSQEDNADNNTWALANNNHDNTWGLPADNQDNTWELPTGKQDNTWELPTDKQDEPPANKQENTWELPTGKQDNTWELPTDKQDNTWELPTDKQDEPPANKQDNTWELPAGSEDNTWELPAGSEDNTWELPPGSQDHSWDVAASTDWNLPPENKKEEPFKWGVEIDSSTAPKENERPWPDLPAKENTGFADGEADGNGVTKGKARRSGGIKKEQAYIPETPSLPTKMSEDLLDERVLKMQLQNDKIRERREHVKADEEAFATLTVAERARKEADRIIQAQVNQSRELNAKRKMEKIANREWDRGKQKPDWEPGRDEEGKPSKGNVTSQKRRGDNVTRVERPKITESPEDGNDQLPNDTSLSEPDKTTHDYIIDDPEQ